MSGPALHQPGQATAPGSARRGETVLETVSLTKVYRMGQVEGVRAGERVVLYPTDNVMDGVRVKQR